MVTSAISTNVGCNLCTTGSVPSPPPQFSSPQWDPGHGIFLCPTSCSGQCETLISIPPCYLSKQTLFPGAARQCPTLLGSTALLCCLEVLLVTQSCMHWGYRPTQCVITFHWPLLSCIQALPSVSHWEWVVISPGWGLPYSFFSVYIKYVTQGSWSKDRAFKHCVCINNYPSLHKVMRMPICSPAPYLHGKCSLSEYRELGCAPISAFRDHLSILSVSRPTELTVKPHEQCVCGINCPGNTIH